EWLGWLDVVVSVAQQRRAVIRPDLTEDERRSPWHVHDLRRQPVVVDEALQQGGARFQPDVLRADRRLTEQRAELLYHLWSLVVDIPIYVFHHLRSRPSPDAPGKHSGALFVLGEQMRQGFRDIGAVRVVAAANGVEVAGLERCSKIAVELNEWPEFRVGSVPQRKSTSDLLDVALPYGLQDLVVAQFDDAGVEADVGLVHFVDVALV